MQKWILFFCFLLTAITAFTQTQKIDLLKQNLYQAKNDEQKLVALLALCDEYHSLNRDTLNDLATKAQQLAAGQNNARYKSLASLAMANTYLQWGWTDSALFYINSALPFNSVADSETRDIYFKLIRQKAICYGGKSDFADALSVLFSALPEAEKYKDTLNTAGMMNTIGSVKIASGESSEALKWVLKAAGLAASDKKYNEALAAIYTNTGNVYNALGKTDSSLYYIRKAISLCKKTENLNYYATALRIHTNILAKQKNFVDAEASLKEMLDIRGLISGEGIVLEDKLALADFYANTGQLDKAIAFCQKQLQTGNLYEALDSSGAAYTNSLKNRLSYYLALAKYYKQAERYPEYRQMLENIITAKDSLYAANLPQAIAEAQEKYEAQKMENTILQQKYSIQRKNFFIYGSLILLAVSLIAAYFIFANYRRRQQLKMMLALENEKRNAANAIKEAEEKERVRIAADLHDNLGAYAASLASNLGYFQQTTGEPAMVNAYREVKNNSNAIISELNDTIWVLKKDALSLTAISDRIKTFINRINKSYPDVTIDVNEQINNDIKLLASQAFHLYRILQEAINNALRHSSGKHIIVTIASDDSWQVSVADDGAGISNAGRQGNGMQNMLQRSDENHWRIEWKQNGGQGTIVQVNSGPGK